MAEVRSEKKLPYSPPDPQESEPVSSTVPHSADVEPTLPEEQIVTGNTSHTRPENRAFYPALDGMRAIAFLMVFFHHYCEMPWGWAGVDLFFVLSGFLITGILFDSRDDTHRVRNFYVRRTLRIFPLYYGILLVLLPFVYRQLTWSWVVWPAYLGNYARFFSPYTLSRQILADAQPYLQTSFLESRHITVYLGHFWSLCIEEQFYLVWPWVVFWIRDRRKLFWVCVASVPICVAARLAGQSFLPAWMLHNEILYRATPFRLDALLLGGGLALSLRGSRAHQLLRASRIALPIAFATLFLWAMFVPGHFWQRPLDLYRYPTWAFTWGLLGIDILAALIIAVAIQPHSVLCRVLSQRALRWLGRISYGAYVLHDIPHFIYFHVARKLIPNHSYPATVVIAFISTCLLAWLSYRFFETPFLNLKERWTIRG